MRYAHTNLQHEMLCDLIGKQYAAMAVTDRAFALHATAQLRFLVTEYQVTKTRHKLGVVGTKVAKLAPPPVKPVAIEAPAAPAPITFPTDYARKGDLDAIVDLIGDLHNDIAALRRSLAAPRFLRGVA